MAAIHGSKARLYLAGYNVSPSMRGGSTPQTNDVVDSSTWGMTSKRYTADPRTDGSFAGEGVWEHTGSTPGSIDDLLAAFGSKVVTFMPHGDTFGVPARALSGIQTTYEIDSPGDDVTGFTMELMADIGFLQMGKVLRPLAGALNISSTGNGTSLDDLGAAGTTTKGAGVALHVISKGGGAGTITVKLQHSSDNSVWNDLITLGGKTAAGLAEYAETAPGVTVQRWLRAQWTVTGGTWDIQVVGGRK